MGTANRLRALMTRRGWTQIQAAEALGVTQTWVSRVLTGRSQHLETFERVAIRLDQLEREPAPAAESVAS